MCAYKPEKIAIREMRKHIGWYIHGMRGSSKTRNEINHTESIDDIKRILDRFFQNVINEEE
jgi:tRNA-dihydrouridine synthase